MKTVFITLLWALLIFSNTSFGLPGAYTGGPSPTRQPAPAMTCTEGATRTSTQDCSDGEDTGDSGENNCCYQVGGETYCCETKSREMMICVGGQYQMSDAKCLDDTGNVTAPIILEAN